MRQKRDSKSRGADAAKKELAALKGSLSTEKNQESVQELASVQDSKVSIPYLGGLITIRVLQA